MSVITKGRTFVNGEQLTAEKLNVLVDDASFNSSKAVDNSTTRVSASGAITVKPQGITSTELAGGSVTFAKLEDVIDDDTMNTASDTTLATSESIKAYVDSNGITQTSGSAPYYGIRAFGAFNGRTNPPTIISSGNVSSITRISTGIYEITLTTPMDSSDYCVVANEDHHLNVTYATSVTVSRVSSSVFRLSTGSYVNQSGSYYNCNYIGFQVIA